MRRGLLALTFAVNVTISVLATSQPADAAGAGSYGDISSTVVPQPGGAPSIFIPAEGVITNSWSANGGWPSYPIALYTTAPPATSTTRGFATSRAVAVLQPDGSPSIFFQGVGGSLWNYWYVNGTWDAAEIASSGVQSAPAAILQPNGSPSVFVVGPNESLLNYWYIPGQGTWGSATAAGAGSIDQVPAVVADPCDGTPDVIGEGPGHTLNEWYYSPGVWRGPGPITGTGTVFSAPGVVLQPDGTTSVFVVGPNHSLLNFWWHPLIGVDFPACFRPNNNTNSLGEGTVAGPGSAYSTPAVALQSDGAPTVFTLGPSGSVLNQWYIAGSGTWGAATVESPGSGTSQVFGVLTQTDGTPEVFFAHQDGSLWLSSYAKGTWANVNWGVSDAPIETFTDPS